MSTTTIKRKALRNRIKAKQRKAKIKLLTAKPTLKNFDVETVKSTFKKQENKKPVDIAGSTKKSEKKEEVIQAAEVKQEIKDVAKADESKPEKSIASTKDKQSKSAPSKKDSNKKEE